MEFDLLILAAGYATRLGKRAESKAKPLLEVAGRPMMDWVLDRFAEIPGLRRVVAVSNSKFISDFRDWERGRLALGERFDLALFENGSVCKEEKLGAVGDLQFGIESAGLGGRNLVVVGGDNLFEVVPSEFVAFSRDRPAVIATYDVGSPEEVKRFASIESDAAGRIVAFEEKPIAPKGTVAGIALYSFQREVLPLIGEYLREGNNPDQAGHLIAWLRDRVPTYACPISGHWFDVGSDESLAAANVFFSDR